LAVILLISMIKNEKIYPNYEDKFKW
jgi:hypothetical protein